MLTRCTLVQRGLSALVGILAIVASGCAVGSDELPASFTVVYYTSNEASAPAGVTVLREARLPDTLEADAYWLDMTTDWILSLEDEIVLEAERDRPVLMLWPEVEDTAAVEFSRFPEPWPDTADEVARGYRRAGGTWEITSVTGCSFQSPADRLRGLLALTHEISSSRHRPATGAPDVWRSYVLDGYPRGQAAISLRAFRGRAGGGSLGDSWIIHVDAWVIPGRSLAGNGWVGDSVLSRVEVRNGTITQYSGPATDLDADNISDISCERCGWRVRFPPRAHGSLLEYSFSLSAEALTGEQVELLIDHEALLRAFLGAGQTLKLQVRCVLPASAIP